ncbi:uncharacterized protein [Typha angustifolia]|uniref:uncharacterized protein n=1 Tax=Typha angustifolia TaxID=59011 RepID=UPI003C2F0105
MEYERIEKPFSQGGGFSPKKLRTMLLRVEKRRKEEEEVESKFSLSSEPETDERGGSVSDECKDVECSTSSETARGQRSKDLNIANMEDSFDSESVGSTFEFHKERGPNRSAIVPPFLKQAPSKWDDAQKWIASPTPSWSSKGSGAQSKMMDKVVVGGGSRQPAAKVVMEVMEEADTKRIDPNLARREIGGQKTANWVSDPQPEVDSYAKNALVVDNVAADSAITLSRHDLSTSHRSATAVVNPISIVRSVSMRDMGTEMTPIASQEPSRTGTPVGATTPTRSPNSSRPSTPQRTPPSSSIAAMNYGDSSKTELSLKELQIKTRREIMILGTQLGKTNIAAWACKEEDDPPASLKTLPEDQPAISIIEARAIAWEEAEKAKYLARFKQEEIKIEAWENHQKAKTEAEIRKVEIEVERMRSDAHDKLMNKLASARQKAEEKRAAAEAKRNQQAAKTAKQADYIRRTGRFPSFSCWNYCS